MNARVEIGSSRPILVTSILAFGFAVCARVDVAQEAIDTEQGPMGVVIEEVGEGSTLAEAGLRPGDVVRAWERLPSPPANSEADSGEIESIFDWMWIEVEQAPRGTVKLLGEREGVERLFEVAMGKWGGNVRPRLPDRVLAVYTKGQEKVEAGEIEEGVELWSELTQLGGATSDGQLRNWIQLRIGEAYAEARDWEQALEAYRAALEDVEAPAAEVAVWGRIGRAYLRQSEFGQAEASYQSALEIAKASWGKSLHTANMENRLGVVAWYRGQRELASTHWKDALEIKEKLAPDSLDVAGSLNNLGIVARARGQFELASEYHQRALEIREKLAPDSLDMAESLNNLGTVAGARGQLELASEYHQRALEIQEKLAPDSLHAAANLSNLGYVARDRGQLELASEYYRRALEIREKLAPDSINVAESLNDLGEATRARGDIDRAAELFQRAIHTLEAQISILGSSHDVKASFRAQYHEYYRDSIETLLQLDRPDDAFAILERSRAQSFLAQLAERDLVFSDIPEELDRDRWRVAWSYNKTQHEIAQLNPREQAEEIETLLTRLRQLRQDSEDITVKIVKASPKLGALRYPQSLELHGARQALDPGTVMLSYSVGEKTTDLFAVTRENPLKVYSLAIGEVALRREVETFRTLIEERRRSSGSRFSTVVATGKRLFQALLEPALEALEQSDRILISPDGPLHRLPFAALIREAGASEAGSGRDWQYLVEWKPLHTVLSGTVYAELRQSRRTPVQPTDADAQIIVAAFGVPEYPQTVKQGDVGEVRDLHVRSVVRRGIFEWKRLPHSRREVEGIAGLYPAAQVYLGADATEERAKSVGKGPRIVHFATHGYLDDRLPLNSFLALTIPVGADGGADSDSPPRSSPGDDNDSPPRSPQGDASDSPPQSPQGDDNGLLQAWEIFERIRLDADLVVLSACNSGLGEEQGGEGLIGLTRAFQYAGARSVASTLWRVADDSTAALMLRFYQHLRDGKPKDEALRAAKLELIRGPIEIEKYGRTLEKDASAPYYWAAFQIIGDWQ